MAQITVMRAKVVKCLGQKTAQYESDRMALLGVLNSRLFTTMLLPGPRWRYLTGFQLAIPHRPDNIPKANNPG
jgi:hypothetical protein